MVKAVSTTFPAANEAKLLIGQHFFSEKQQQPLHRAKKLVSRETPSHTL